MRKTVFCGFSLLPLILDVNVQFSEKVRISPEVPPGRNADNMALIFGRFYVVNHQETEIMHKNGRLCTACSPRLKIVHICQKMFFVNFTHFLQSNEPVRKLMLYVTFSIFGKIYNFCR